MYKGGAGGYTFYVRGGEQVVRQRKNNSNYGETASRSYAQMRRRVMWANLVNFYKLNKFWMPKAFELRSAGQTDYNRFMQLNIPFSEHALTKEQALLGVCAPFLMQVSEGSLPAIQYDNSAAVPFVTDIKISNSYSAGTQSVAQLSQDIINNNPFWQNGDNLAIIRIEMAPYEGNPYIIPHYYELTLDTSDTGTVLNTLRVFTESGVAFTNGFVNYPIASQSNSKYAFVLIHTRKEGGQLKVSTQELIVPQDDYYYFVESQHVDNAIASYGLDASVPLDPGQGGASSETAVTSFSTLLTGKGDNPSASQFYRMRPGTYHLTAIPDPWSMTGVTGSSNAVAITCVASPGGTPTTLFTITKSALETAGSLGSITFVVPDNAPYIRVTIRAAEDSGVVISAS